MGASGSSGHCDLIDYGDWHQGSLRTEKRRIQQISVSNYVFLGFIENQEASNPANISQQQLGLFLTENMSEIDFEELAEIELQKDEAEHAVMEKRKTSFTPATCEDTELSINHPYYDVARHGIVQLAGDDNSGRRVITFSCCRMPPSHQLNHSRLLEYLRYTLDQYVENDYTLVYFHYGLNSRNKPSLNWLQSAYKEFDRKYKKNLKALYVVHPTNFIKILWNIFKPLISHKFGKKITYLNYLSDLREHLKYDQLNIPEDVIRHDENLRDKQKGRPPPSAKVPPPRPPLPTQQFGVSLQYLKDKNKGQLIPPVMKQTVFYLKSKGDALIPPVAAVTVQAPSAEASGFKLPTSLMALSSTAVDTVPAQRTLPEQTRTAFTSLAPPTSAHALSATVQRTTLQHGRHS
ncbi:Rho GTPase-activating protein 8 [Chelonia mydas]|uniref:Rho GTPase-activating protein 8 n=1 Tax=Chelonia mydas TaxID=8469 RepID=M7BPQ5_CHEMY|nr:Rho GTPase-activating protein 8 [Chelonia mydas]